jgi:hypothetical protein
METEGKNPVMETLDSSKTVILEGIKLAASSTANTKEMFEKEALEAKQMFVNMYEKLKIPKVNGIFANLNILNKYSHIFEHRFCDVATAFWRKYRSVNTGFNTITIADVKQLGSSRFCVIRRLESWRGEIKYERIVFDNKNNLIMNDFFSDPIQMKIAERCIYLYDNFNKTVHYNLLVYNRGINSFLRRKLFFWGVQNMENLIKEKSSYI